MFVMTHDEIAHVLHVGKVFIHANPVVNHRPQKEDPNRIQITAGGNMINYKEELSVRTADINTVKLHWNSVISTDKALYMCLDIGNFYLMAALEYFEYMRIPLALFPIWIIEQYDLKKPVLNGFVHLEMRRAIGGLPQAEYLQTSDLGGNWPRLSHTNASILLVCRTTSLGPYRSHSLLMIPVLNMSGENMQTT